MSSILKTAIQSAILKSAANLTVQVAGRWQSSGPNPSPVDWQRVVEFAIFGLIQAQLNYWWQQFLEDTFPTRPETDKAPSKSKNNSKDPKPAGAAGNDQQGAISWPNVICKLVVDQTLGLFIMNSTFLVCTNAVRLKSAPLVLEAVNEKIWTVIRAAWKLWPWVSLCNFLWVPVEKRVLVASVVGFGWTMVLALMSMGK